MLLTSFKSYLLGGVLIILLASLFIFCYLLNKKTPKPEGCENLDKCDGCQVTSCAHRKVENEEE